MKENYCCEKEPQKLYKIGMFAQMNKITVKTLRHYDDIDLLKPYYIDENNGYRYYVSDQLPILHRILALKEIGFSLDEIKQVIQGTSEDKLLKKKKSELMLEVADLTKKIASIESYLSGDDYQNEYHIIIKSLPEVIIASMRVRLHGYSQLFDKMPEMGMEMERLGCECAIPEYCFTIYYDGEYRESDIDAQICEAVTQKKADSKKVQFSILPEVEMAACVLHKGPYETLPKAYGAIINYIEECGYEIVGPQRESYIDGIWNKESPNDWLTEIQFPIQKIQKED
ncbi:MAG: MerR family transcriptional regulator [Longibaculum sp.]